jgi:hypothetical protein
MIRGSHRETLGFVHDQGRAGKSDPFYFSAQNSRGRIPAAVDCEANARGARVDAEHCHSA